MEQLNQIIKNKNRGKRKLEERWFYFFNFFLTFEISPFNMVSIALRLVEAIRRLALQQYTLIEREGGKREGNRDGTNRQKRGKEG